MRRGKEEEDENKKRKTRREQSPSCALRSHVYNIKQTLVFKIQLS